MIALAASFAVLAAFLLIFAIDQKRRYPAPRGDIRGD